MAPTMSAQPATITIWVCDTCGYWRQDEATGVHVTTNPEDPRGATVTHTLRPATYVAASEEDTK